ncbi:MAG: peptide ABC transporter substrate-binding protein [Mycoplasmatales bacterium]
MKKIIIVLIVFIVSLSGCKQSGNNAFVFPTFEVEGLDSRTGTYAVTVQLLTDTQAGLLKVNHQGKLENGTAKEVKTSNDGLLYEIKLRDDIFWVDHTGEKVRKITAQDYVDAWTYFINPENKGTYNLNFMLIKNAEKITKGVLPLADFGAKAVDETTIKIELEYAAPYFKELLSFFTYLPVNTSFAQKQGENYGTSPETTLFSGPYYVTDFDKAGEIKLKPNPEYYDKQNVKITELTYQTIKDLNTQFQSYESGELDYTVYPSAADYQKGKENKKAIDKETARLDFVSFNTQGEYTKNINLRKALQFAFDSERGVKTVYGDGSVARHSLIPVGLTKNLYGKDYRATNQDNLTKFDLVQAKKYLEKALNELDVEKPSELTLTYLTDDTSSNRKNAEYIKGMYEQNLGIKIELATPPTAKYRQDRVQGNFDLVGGGWIAAYGDPDTYLQLFTTSNIDSINVPRYSNPEYDKEVNEAKKIVNIEERFKRLAELERKILVDEAIIVPYYQQNAAYEINEKFELGNSLYQKISFEYTDIKE